MRLLLVGAPEGTHIVRVIEMISGLGWDIHLFPCWPIDAPINPEMRDVTVWHPSESPLPKAHPSVQVERVSRLLPLDGRSRRPELAGIPMRLNRAASLVTTIRRIEPDIVHSHEFQHSGYLTLQARARLGAPFPSWIVSNYGSDIYLFGRDPEHAERIRAVLAACDYYACECRRDIELARAFGYRGEVLPVLPIAGGFDLERLARLRQPGPPSARRTLVVKGYQHFAGRALTAVRALEMSADVLRGYRIALYRATDEVRVAGERLCRVNGLKLTIYENVPYDDILRMHGGARASIGLSISDAISTSFLEALAMGSLPIQSDTSCANEWARDGEGALFVGPENADGVAAAIHRALTDDALVDRAAEINAAVAAARLDQSRIRPQVIEYYERIASRGRRCPPPGPDSSERTASELQVAPMTETAVVRDRPAVAEDLPRVTVITPAYNRAELVGETIRSVLGQDYPNLEYVVLDDGSTDGTLAAIKKYEGSLRWASHENMGEARTVNRGFELAGGEIIGVVNSDDPLRPGAVRAIVEVMLADPDVLVVYPDWDVIDERGELIHHVPTFDYSYVNMVKWHYCVPGPGTFFRRSVVERLGGRDPSFRYVADWDFWLRAGLLGPFRRLPRTLATFRHHLGSASSYTRGEAMAREHIQVIDKLYAQPNLPPEVLAVRAEAYANAFCTAGIVAGGALSADEHRFRWYDDVLSRLFPDSAEDPLATVTRLQEEVTRLHQAVAKRDRVLAPLGVLALARVVRRLRAAIVGLSAR